MTAAAPDLGPCVCGADHEHSDFEPYRCAECSCERHQATTAGVESPAEPPGARHGVRIPETLGFAVLRVTQTAEWLDDTLAGIRDTSRTNPDDPLAVCALADLIEHNWPEEVDLIDALALAIRRLAAQPTKTATVIDTLRRMRQR